MDRKERIHQILQYLGVAYSAMALKSGINPSNLKKMLDGEQTITDKTLHRIINTYPQFNIEWLKTGDGEMLNSTAVISQTGDGSVIQNGKAGHDLNQTNNSEKLLQDFISGLKSQNKLAEKAMSQTDKAMDQMNKALDEISEQRKLMDRLITIIENK